MRWPGLVRVSPFAAALAAMCFSAGSAVRAQSRLQVTLPPGQFAVGFKAVDLYDRTREFGERGVISDHEAGVHGRPLQVSIWYPARTATGAKRMRYREYTELVSLPGELPRHDSVGRAAALSTFMRSFGGEESARVQRELNAITRAVRDAASAHGSFPVVVYGPSLGALSFENSELCEYLASHGYIVVASPSWGASGSMTSDLEGIEAQARDMEFLIAYGRTLPNADAAHVAVMGFSWAEYRMCSSQCEIVRSARSSQSTGRSPIGISACSKDLPGSVLTG